MKFEVTFEQAIQHTITIEASCYEFALDAADELINAGEVGFTDEDIANSEGEINLIACNEVPSEPVDPLLDIIRGKAECDRRKAVAAAEAEERKQAQLKADILALGSRIERLCKLAQACIDNGIKLPNKQETYRLGYSEKNWGGQEHSFYADGFTHHVGFDRDGNEMGGFRGNIVGLRIKNGGACGPVDLCVGEKGEAYGLTMKQYSIEETTTTPSNYDMGKFLEEFPKFEECFLKWVSNLK